MQRGVSIAEHNSIVEEVEGRLHCHRAAGGEGVMHRSFPGMSEANDSISPHPGVEVPIRIGQMGKDQGNHVADETATIPARRAQVMQVLLVDDHAMFREGVALLLRPILGDNSQVLEVGSCDEAVALLELRQGSFDLVLMDLMMPGTPGQQGIEWIRERYPAIPVVALSSSDDRETVLKALDAGAMGFIPKASNSAILVAAIQLILARGIYLPPSIFLGRPGPAGTAAPSSNPPQVGEASRRTPADLGLTPRQADVLYLLLQGKPAKLICRELDLSPSTVKAHTSAVLRALNVTTRTQAVVAAGRLGLRFEPPSTA
jgi:DNA-binding NarL/FixJ family response regulator